MSKKSFFILMMFSFLLPFPLTTVLAKSSKEKLKLYWFIPDGLRAEPDTFKVFEWAQKGELPNIKKLMDQGSYGYSLPVFPSHTPVNFAALLTGTLPKTNGVADGPMHTEGNPLSRVSIGGFSSAARKIPAVWSLLEEKGLKVGIISTPGSTPPEIQKGFVVRGRWGNWGLDTPAINVESVGDNSQRTRQARSSRLFFFGPQLTIYTPLTKDSWKLSSWSENPAQFFQFEIQNHKFYGALIDSKKDGKIFYDKVVLSLDGQKENCVMTEQQWCDWQPLMIAPDNIAIKTHIKFHAIKLDGSHFFRLRILFNNLNETLTIPTSLAQKMSKSLGPMVDFVDNFPPQLIYYPEDKQTFLKEQDQSFAWHQSAITFLLKDQQPDVVIHNIYNPNQMLTSRWWLGNIDPRSEGFHKSSNEEKQKSWSEVKQMYKQIDAMIGEILKSADKNTTIVVSSDHGVAALNKSFHINNFFAKQGWLKFTMDSATGEPVIDWKNTKVIFLKMDGVFINPDGLDGNWRRGQGPKYQKLREQVIMALKNTKDSKNGNPISQIVKWEDVENTWHLPKERVGDLILANKRGFGFSEEPTAEAKPIFSAPIVTGYKQAILPEEGNEMWTPFLISSPQIKKSHLIEKPFSQIDQLPTILKALSIENPVKMDGKPLNIFEE